MTSANQLGESYLTERGGQLLAKPLVGGVNPAFALVQQTKPLESLGSREACMSCSRESELSASFCLVQLHRTPRYSIVGSKKHCLSTLLYHQTWHYIRECYSSCKREPSCMICCAIVLYLLSLDSLAILCQPCPSCSCHGRGSRTDIRCDNHFGSSQ